MAAQPWCAGRRGALFGQSYDGCAALHTAAARHPSVAAVVAVNPFLDMFTDISAPGGARPTSQAAPPAACSAPRSLLR